ncbi:SHOCT domain-containing protein [Cellulomonas humilata]|uniref:SHOCT domain-containing protein n=1 Tax=Cellulomonas humilata TaxID=144055 RepID=A0A7Y6DWK1_9CELL|nr:SHOCT domain-containing protein [Cellulomonas humilata]NUU15984.1 SHOCT domain-containing protein [Cellulomonas humilata]
MPDPLAPAASDTAFGVVFFLVTVTIVVLIIASAVRASRNRSVLREAGLDPATATSQVLAQAHQSQLLAPPRSAETRLAEAIDLHQRGLITTDELGELRQRILGEV